MASGRNQFAWNLMRRMPGKPGKPAFLCRQDLRPLAGCSFRWWVAKRLGPDRRHKRTATMPVAIMRQVLKQVPQDRDFSRHRINTWESPAEDWRLPPPAVPCFLANLAWTSCTNVACFHAGRLSNTGQRPMQILCAQRCKLEGIVLQTQGLEQCIYCTRIVRGCMR